MCKMEFNNHFCLGTCPLKNYYTILSQASPHSLSTKNWGWAVSQRRCLNGWTFLMEGPTPNVSCLRTKLTSIFALPVLCQAQLDSGKSCKVDQPIACCQASATFIASSTQTLYCKQGTLWTRFQTGVCVCNFAAASEALQNCCSYVLS